MSEAVCGTPRAYWRHKRRGERADKACRAAFAAWQRDYMAARKRRTPVKETEMLDQAGVPAAESMRRPGGDHPLIRGLFASLPPEAEWRGQRDRLDAWFAVLEASLDFVYGPVT